MEVIGELILEFLEARGLSYTIGLPTLFEIDGSNFLQLPVEPSLAYL
jgi:hypothetical protein